MVVEDPLIYAFNFDESFQCIQSTWQGHSGFVQVLAQLLSFINLNRGQIGQSRMKCLMYITRTWGKSLKVSIAASTSVWRCAQCASTCQNDLTGANDDGPFLNSDPSLENASSLQSNDLQSTCNAMPGLKVKFASDVSFITLIRNDIEKGYGPMEKCLQCRSCHDDLNHAHGGLRQLCKWYWSAWEFCLYTSLVNLIYSHFSTKAMRFQKMSTLFCRIFLWGVQLPDTERRLWKRNVEEST